MEGYKFEKLNLKFILKYFSSKNLFKSVKIQTLKNKSKLQFSVYYSEVMLGQLYYPCKSSQICTAVFGKKTVWCLGKYIYIFIRKQFDFHSSSENTPQLYFYFFLFIEIFNFILRVKYIVKVLSFPTIDLNNHFPTKYINKLYWFNHCLSLFCS